MTHVRKQIRDRIAANLLDLTATGKRVFESRLYSFQNAELPGICVYTKSETSERDTLQTTSGMTRTLDILVEGYAVAPQTGLLSLDMENMLDQICEESEAALGADPTCNGLCLDMFLSATEINYSGEGDLPVGTAVMTWTCTYRTTTTDPGTSL